MPWYEVVALLTAGMAAGTINTIVGSGTLITFPTLLFFGIPPLVANVSNTIGLVAGGLTGIHGYRAELAGQGSVLRRLVPASLLGAVTGAILLLELPESAFDAIVPILIAAALLLVLLGPRIQAWAATRHPDHDSRSRHLLLVVGIFAAGVYGGYFGAAQGILLVGIMSILMTITLQRTQWVEERPEHGGQRRCCGHVHALCLGTDRLVRRSPDRRGLTCRGVCRSKGRATAVPSGASWADRRHRSRGHREDRAYLTCRSRSPTRATNGFATTSP